MRSALNYVVPFAVTMAAVINCSSPKKSMVSHLPDSSRDTWIASSQFKTNQTFGPFRIMQKSMQIYSAPPEENSQKFFSLLGPVDDTHERKEYLLTVIQGTDTASILLNVWHYEFGERISHTSYYHGHTRHTTSHTDTAQYRDAIGIIHLNNDSTPWEFCVRGYGDPRKIGKRFTQGLIIHDTNTYAIEPVKRKYSNHEEEAYTEGILIKSDDEIASLDLWGRPYISMRKDLPSNTKLAIAAVLGSILETRGLNGFFWNLFDD